MAVLITGAAGYVGSHTTYALAEAGYDLVAVDNLSTGFREALPANIRFYQGDIRDEIFLERLFTSEKIDGVIHFAAFSQVAESMREPLKYYDNNVYGTSVLLSCMLAHNVMRIVFSSTAAVYGEPTQIPIEESAPVHPTNCYGETKYAMERMMEWLQELMACTMLHYDILMPVAPSRCHNRRSSSTRNPSYSFGFTGCFLEYAQGYPFSEMIILHRTAAVFGIISMYAIWHRRTSLH